MGYFFNNTIENQQIYLYSGGYDPTEKGHTYGPTVRSGYMLHYIYSGKGIFSVNGRNYHLKAGDFFFIEPDKLIKYEADQDDPWAFYWIGFRGELVKEYLTRTSISANYPIFTSKNNQQIKDILSEIIEISLISEENDLLLNVKLLEILYQLTRCFPAETSSARNKKNTMFMKAAQYIQNNYERDLQISELSKSLSIDRSYLHRLFIKELGIGPKEYLTNVRIRKAKELLKQSDLPVKVIAYSVGYENTQQFSRVFKKIVGISPKEFR
ncbi:AraC family transcriptional regulator [Enterococcus devriesei]|uniref:AraC family transcriptional regulator n=1 Tax=Enterococcus devriesei TaxID=319970 RepID=UPI0036D2AC77